MKMELLYSEIESKAELLNRKRHSVNTTENTQELLRARTAAHTMAIVELGVHYHQSP